MNINALKSCLKDFSSDTTNLGYDSDVAVTFTSDICPSPHLVFITLVTLLGYKFTGQHEKVAWIIPIKYRGASLLLADRKFGFSVRTLNNADADEHLEHLVEEMLKKLNKGIKIAEKIIQPLIKKQIDQGEVSAKNKYYYHNTKYLFFRKLAKRKFNSAAPSPKARKALKGDNPSIPQGISWDPLKHQREGSFFATAMIDAYYSKLEHILTLLAPFVTYMTGNKLITFISSNWTDKFKTVIKNKEAKKNYDALLMVKREYRNPIAHGFNEGSGKSLLFHFPQIGAIPMHLSKYNSTIHWSFNPITSNNFIEVCDVFDDFDRFLNKGPLRRAMRYIKSGLLINFDQQTCMEYKNLLLSDSACKYFIERRSYLEDIHANMDW